MDHMQFLLTKAQDSEEEISGHTLMVSCPPESHIIEHPEVPYPYDEEQQRHKPQLASLMNLSQRLNLDGEITPVMAWSMLLSHPRFSEFTAADFEVIRDDLKGKVRCYG